MSSFRTTARAGSLLASRRPVIAKSLQFAPRWMSVDAQNKLLAADLKKADPAVFDIVEKVRGRCCRFMGIVADIFAGEKEAKALH